MGSRSDLAELLARDKADTKLLAPQPGPYGLE